MVASDAGYSLFAGGAAGARPRIAGKIKDNLTEEEIIALVEKIIGLYERKGKTPERLGIFIEKMGWKKFKEEVAK